jgi:hypothetical protein
MYLNNFKKIPLPLAYFSKANIFASEIEKFQSMTVAVQNIWWWRLNHSVLG